MNSIASAYFGGNIDNWQVGKGTSMHRPAAVKGALFPVGVDFGMTQVVDANWGVHAIIKKAMFGA